MPIVISGERPPRLRIDRDRIPVSGGNGARIETVTIMNEGGGVLRGTVISDVHWITIPSLKIDTPFVFPLRIEISPEKVPLGTPARGMVTLVTNGGSAKIIVEFTHHPQPTPKLSLDDRTIQFCNLRRGEKIQFDLTVRNTGKGILNGTIESESDWVEVKIKSIWTRDVQVIPVIIHTATAPQVRQPVGKVRIRSTGGDQDITIPIHFRGKDGPRLRIDPPRIRCTWEKRGTIENVILIHNEGEGLLRGTIPSPVPWLKFIPSIFPVEKSTKILLKIDTRKLPGEGTLSIPVPIITNAGRDTLIVEVTAAKRTMVVTPARRARPARYQYRSRLIAYGLSGESYILISTGRSGGEGEIYHISGIPGRCAKIFHPHRRTGEIEEKLRVMVTHPPPVDLLNNLTWPLGLLTDLPGGGKVIGYLMRLLPDNDFKPAHLWYDEPGPRSKTGMARRLSLAHTLSRIVSGVHNSGHTIGDLRENNLLINNAGELILIDTDSFQIKSQTDRRTFWSRVGTGEYLPPEHLDGSFAEDGCDRRYGDHFALAVLIFRFLMDGVHPFQAKGPLVRDAPATTDKILLGYYAYESRLAGISPPDYAPPYDSVPAGVRSLFREAFVSGHLHPADRPDASRWEVTLRSLIPEHEQSNVARTIRKEYSQNPPEKPGKKEGLTDGSGDQIIIGERLFRITAGSIFRSSRENMQILLPDHGSRMPEPEEIIPLPASLPNSLIMPLDLVFRDRTKPVGWIIPAFDPARYLPWHMIADPESRKNTGRTGFSFRHRVACSRNLAAALISARLLEIPAFDLSDRSVFVSPDSSVRILCIPKISEGKSTDDQSTNISPLSILIFRMLMDGYHPFHATGSWVKGYRSPERRMKAGLYPWEYSGPRLSPPPGAPGIERIPGQIRDLFREEFTRKRSEEPGGEDEHPPSGPDIWFDIIDQIFSFLFQCTKNPDHWYLPGEGSCPWCRTKISATNSLQKEIIAILPRPGLALPCLATPFIAGYLQIPRRFRRRIPAIVSATRWITIPLSSEQVYYQLLPRPQLIPILPPVQKGGILLVRWQRQWLVCIPKRPANMPEPQCMDQKENVPVPNLFNDAVLRFRDEISLIDEMIWISTTDRLRGEGIGVQKQVKGTSSRRSYPRKKPVDIMLMPIDLPWYDESLSEEDITDPVPREVKKIARKKGTGKGIRGKLQSMLRDFLEPVSDDI